jgi:DNA-binding transcriptional ArsR family regulator
MTKDKFVLVSLKEEESKEIAQAISNKTSRKILDYLADKEATESELAEKLGVPISTVHYNLQALVKAKMVEADEYHYSSKGKEVLHYKLANKYIIIAPKSTFGLKEKLKSILPAGLIAVAISAAGYFFASPKEFFGVSDAPVAALGKAEAADTAMRAFAVTEPVQQVSFWTPNPALWFLVGCVVTLLLIITIEYIRYKKR